MARPGAPDEWSAARSGLDALETELDTHAAAAAYFAKWPRHAPDFFVDTSRKSREAVRLAFGDGEGWAARLLTCLETPAHFSLHAQHLDLDPSAAAPHLCLDRGNVARWKEATLRHFRGPFRARLALGDGGHVHCHVLADLADGPPELPRDGEIVKPCLRYFEAAVGYQLKPPMEYSAAHLALWLEAKKRGRLPTLAWSRGVPKKRRWHERSVLRKTFGKPPENATPEPPQTAAQRPTTPAPAATPAKPQPPPAAPAPSKPFTAAASPRRPPRPHPAPRHRRGRSETVRRTERPGHRRRPTPQARGPPAATLRLSPPPRPHRLS